MSKTIRTRTSVWQRLVICLSAACFICSCSDPPQPAAPKESLSLAVSESFLSAPLYLAKLKGFFSDEGLDVTLKEYPSGKLSTRAMLAGEADVATVADLPIVVNGFQGENFCILATFASSSSFLKLLARRDHGIAGAQDLKGKKVGANTGTSSHYFLGAFLTDHLLAMKDIDMVHYKTTNLSQALIDNEVDAISIWHPHEQHAIDALGSQVINIPTSKVYRVSFNLASTRNYATTHHRALVMLIRAIQRAVTYAREDKPGATQLIADLFKVKPSLIDADWAEYTFGVTLEQALLVQLDDMARWALASNLVPRQKIPNFFDYIYFDILSDTFPDRISMIR